MGGDLDHSDFVDPDFETAGAGVRPALAAAGASIAMSTTARPPSREELGQQASAAQQALVELKRRQEELERERAQLEEARRRRIEYEQGREEMLTHLIRGIGLLDESEQSARRDSEQMARTLADLRAAHGKVSALDESVWTAESYHTELIRALTTIENARMEWNAAQVRWSNLVSRQAPAAAGNGPGETRAEGLPIGPPRTPSEWARIGLALTWPVALAVLAVGVVLAIVLARR